MFTLLRLLTFIFKSLSLWGAEIELAFDSDTLAQDIYLFYGMHIPYR